MQDMPCTIYDCEFDSYIKAVIKNNIVYAIDSDGNLDPARNCLDPAAYYDIYMVQFYTGNYHRNRDERNKNNSKWGYFWFATGEVIVEPVYESCRPFYGDRGRVRRNSKYGFVDLSGKEVVETIWDDADSHFLPSGISWVKKNGKFGYVGKDGKVLVKPQFEEVHRFVEIEGKNNAGKYAARIKKNGKYGFIDDNGNYIFKPVLDKAKDFWNKAYAPVMAYGLWTFLDTKGEFVVPLQFYDVGYEDYLYIEEVRTKKKDSPEKNYESISAEIYTVFKDDKWGLMDSDLNIVMAEPKNNYLIYKDIKVYIKDGHVTQTVRPKFES